MRLTRVDGSELSIYAAGGSSLVTLAGRELLAFWRSTRAEDKEAAKEQAHQKQLEVIRKELGDMRQDLTRAQERLEHQEEDLCEVATQVKELRGEIREDLKQAREDVKADLAQHRDRMHETMNNLTRIIAGKELER